MAKKHDEGRDVMQLNRIAGVRVNQGAKTITIKIGSIVGIHSRGRIDYLTHYCGYV
jgi:hypothetical protein